MFPVRKVFDILRPAVHRKVRRLGFHPVKPGFRGIDLRSEVIEPERELVVAHANRIQLLIEDDDGRRRILERKRRKFGGIVGDDNPVLEACAVEPVVRGVDGVDVIRSRGDVHAVVAALLRGTVEEVPERIFHGDADSRMMVPALVFRIAVEVSVRIVEVPEEELPRSRLSAVVDMLRDNRIVAVGHPDVPVEDT